VSITGGIKFFEKSKCLEIDGGLAEATSGDASAEYAIDQNVETKWRSSGSNDVSTETLTLTFASATIDRLFLQGINLKGFDVMYDLAGTWTHFAAVVGIGGAKANITETAFAQSTAYYEFTPVTTTSIRIQASTTQTANEEKYISQVIATAELGTLQGYPQIKKIEQNRNNRVVKTLSGFYSVQKSLEVASFDLEFKDYPAATAYNVDIALMMELHDSEDPFLVWLCGGRYSTSYFKYTLRGYRLDDIYQMQISKALGLSYKDGIYKNPVSAKVELESVI
jgi:hypothetical protein